MKKKFSPFIVEYEGRKYQFPGGYVEARRRMKNNDLFFPFTSEEYKHPFVYKGGSIDWRGVSLPREEEKVELFLEEIINLLQHPQQELQSNTPPVYHLNNERFNEYLIQEELLSMDANHYSERTNQQ